MKQRAQFLFWFILLLFRLEARQPPDIYVVGQITVEGNQKTLTRTITREMFVQPGDSISLDVLVGELERNRLQLMNTHLFVRVDVDTRNWDLSARTLDIHVRVVEAWYIYPYPVFELADRNFNIWWDDYGRSLRRINYGIRFYHNNLSGRRDVLKAVVQFGFTNKYQLVYNLPFFDKKQQWGLSFQSAYSRNKEINYATLGNQQQFHRDPDGVLLEQFILGASATYRRKRQVTHLWEAVYHRNTIDPNVRKDLNPDFFLGSLHQRYTTLAYEFIADTRDIRPYPLHGGFLRLRVQKDGIGKWEDVHSLYLSALAKEYLSFNRRLSLELIAGGRLAVIREKQPFANSQALGYGSHYIRGYEYYVIDGLDYLYNKSSLRLLAVDRTVFWGDLMPFPNLREMPYRVYLVLNNDMGFANNPYYGEGNDLSNTLLWGYGAGIDLVVYYNKLFRLEFSRNYLGENGVFLHWATRF